MERAEWMNRVGIDVVVDVGANSGQYGRLIRETYDGRIVSFEPLADAYATLKEGADERWETFNVALGAKPGRASLNVSANSYSSSLLEITPEHTLPAPEARYVGRQETRVATLDDFDGEIAGEGVLLKIDVQGSEDAVLRGARRLLGRVRLLELELCLVPLYRRQMLAAELCARVRRLGFVPVGFDVAFADPRSGELLALDGLFTRTDDGAR